MFNTEQEQLKPITNSNPEQGKLLMWTPLAINNISNWRMGGYLPLSAELVKDRMTVFERLQLEDARIQPYCSYDEKMRANYMFTKYYLNRDDTEIIIERIFHFEAVKGYPTWFGIADSRFGTFKLYQRMVSKFPYLKKENDDIGLFYRYDNGQIVCYSVDDSPAVENCISYIFNHPDEVKSFMLDMKEIDERRKDSPYLRPSRFYRSDSGHDTALTILDI